MKQSYFLNYKVVECIKDYEDYGAHKELRISIRSSDIINNIRRLGKYDIHMIIFLKFLFVTSNCGFVSLFSRQFLF